MTWNDAARSLTIEPGPPPGATNLPVQRVFRVQLLPEGRTREAPYDGARVEVVF
jgi:hypothetical protein